MINPPLLVVSVPLPPYCLCTLTAKILNVSGCSRYESGNRLVEHGHTLLGVWFSPSGTAHRGGER